MTFHVPSYNCSKTGAFFLSLLVWPILPTNCRCRGLLLHLITLRHTHTHTHTHIQVVELPQTRDRTVVETSNCTTHNTHNRQTSIPRARLKPAILSSERPQTCALDRAVNGKWEFYELCVFNII